jgi:peptidoglycan/xylan/chitin deacetylase (PgdA/CDA1 family)
MDRVFLIFFLFLAMGCATGSADKKPLVVVLSFDYEDLSVPGGGENLGAVLAMLERHNITAAFFILGATAKRYPGRVRSIYERGHLLGMHTYYHNFPIFSMEDAELIGRIYNRSVEAEWSLSFKTPEAFKADLEASRRAIKRAVGSEVEVEMFRAPSLVVNWAAREVYYGVLRERGVKLDSSIYQDFENPRAYYIEKDVVVVPVVTFESRLKNPGKALELAEKSSRAGVPFHLVAHLQSLGPQKLAELEDFLNTLEARYEVKYLRLDEVQGYYENIY